MIKWLNVNVIYVNFLLACCKSTTYYSFNFPFFDLSFAFPFYYLQLFVTLKNTVCLQQHPLKSSNLQIVILFTCHIISRKCGWKSFERFTMSHMIRQNNYNLKHNSYFLIPNVKSVYHGTKRLSHLGPRIWNLVPDKLKQLSDLYEIKNWMPKNCLCRLCKCWYSKCWFY